MTPSKVITQQDMDHRAPDGAILLTEKELNDTFTDIERDYIVKPLIDSGRIRITPATKPKIMEAGSNV